MAAVVKDLQNGKPVRISYRHKIIGTLQPAKAAKPTLKRGSPEAILAAFASVNLGKIPKKLQDPNYTFKQQLADLRQADLDKK
jgi:hypothetical protein